MATNLDLTKLTVGYSGGGFDVQAWSAKLDALAELNYPSVNGYVLSSTTGGTLSWVAQTGGGGGVTWPLISTDGNLSFGSNDGTKAWINDDGSASLAQGEYTFSADGSTVNMLDALLTIDALSVNDNATISQDGSASFASGKYTLSADGSAFHMDSGVIFLSGLLISGQTAINSDGSAAFAGDQFSISSSGAIFTTDISISSTAPAISFFNTGGASVKVRLNQKNNDEGTWAWNVDGDNDDAIDDPSKTAWKMSLDNNRFEMQVMPAGNNNWGTEYAGFGYNWSADEFYIHNVLSIGNALYVDGNLIIDGTGELKYPNGDPLTDTSANLYYSDGNGVLADNQGQIIFSTDTVHGANQLVDINGSIKFNNGNILGDFEGSIYGGDGNILFDNTTSPVQFNYPGLGSAHPLANGYGALFRGGNGGGQYLIDDYDNLFLSVTGGGIYDPTSSLGSTGQTLVNSGGVPFWANLDISDVVGFGNSVESALTIDAGLANGLVILDDSGNLRYPTGGYPIADTSGNLYWSNGNILAASNGYLYNHDGTVFVDSADNVYLRAILQDSTASNGTSGQVLTISGTSGFPVWSTFSAPITAITGLGTGVATALGNSTNTSGGVITGTYLSSHYTLTTALGALATVTAGTGVATAAANAVNTANAFLVLDSGGKVATAQLPSSVLGALNYQTTWNANTNTPTLTSSTGTKGYFYVVSVAGTTTLDGLSSWNVGDWAVFNGSVWEKLDGVASEVISVAGRTGAVTLSNTDISGLGALATVTAGTGVATAAANTVNATGGFLTYGVSSSTLQTLIGSGVYDASGAAATAQSNAEAFSANASNISSGTINAARVPTLNQNTTGSAGSFTGNLAGDVTGTQGATVVGKINGTSLAGLASGIIFNTTGTGIPSILTIGSGLSLVGSSLSATGFSGTLSGDVTGPQSSTVVGKINGTSLAGLATGLLKNTTTTGVPSIAVAGTDYLVPTGSGNGLTNMSSYNSITINAAGNTNITRSTRFDLQYVTVSGSNASSISFLHTNAVAGDVQEMFVSMPATTAVITVYDSSTSGTLLSTLTGNGVAYGTTLSYAYSGTAWVPFKKGALLIGNNLSDLNSASTARTNLGLGTAALISSTAGGDLSGTLPSPTVVALNGTSLAGLATGLLKNTTTTGVPSIAVAGTDYVVPSGSITGSAGSVALANITGAGTGVLTSLANATNSASGVVALNSYGNAPINIQTANPNNNCSIIVLGASVSQGHSIDTALANQDYAKCFGTLLGSLSYFNNYLKVTTIQGTILTASGTAPNFIGTMSVTSATGLMVGQIISGTGGTGSLPAGTIITFINGTTITLWNGVTTLATGSINVVTAPNIVNVAYSSGQVAAGNNATQVVGTWSSSSTSIALTSSPNMGTGSVTVLGPGIPVGATGTVSGSTLTLASGTGVVAGTAQTLYLGAGTITATWSGTLGVGSTIFLPSSPTVAQGWLMCSSTHIPLQYCTVVANVLTLSVGTTGSGTSETITFTGNNDTDRYNTLIHPHRPVANGGDGLLSNGTVLLFGDGSTNEISASQTAATVGSNLSTLITTIKADGFKVLVCNGGTFKYGTAQNWTAAQETIREAFVTLINTRQITADLYVNTEGNLLTDPGNSYWNQTNDGTHLTAAAHALVAARINDVLIHGYDSSMEGACGLIYHAINFTNNVTTLPASTFTFTGPVAFETSTSVILQQSPWNVSGSGRMYFSNTNPLGFGVGTATVGITQGTSLSGILDVNNGGGAIGNPTYQASGGVRASTIILNAIGAPTFTIGVSAGQSTTYTYVATWLDAAYNESAPSATVTVTNGNSSLSVGNLSFTMGTPPLGACYYNIYRTSTSGGLAAGLIVLAHGIAFLSTQKDSGQAIITSGNGYYANTPPGAGTNSTGVLTVGTSVNNPFATGAASYTLVYGFNVMTGTTASQTATLPPPTTASKGTHCIVKNQSSQSWTIASASGSQIVASSATTASANVTLTSGSDTTLWCDGTYWNQLH